MHAIFYRSLHRGARGVLHQRVRVPSGRYWRGATAVHLSLDCGLEGWFRSGPAKRLKREPGAYERLRADPLGVLADAASRGPVALARALGQACAATPGAYYSSHPRLEDGTVVSLSDDALRLVGALRGGPVAELVRSIPGWLSLLDSADPRAGEVVPAEDAFLIPTTKMDHSLFPVSWSVSGVRPALWGALQCLLYEEGLTVDPTTRRELAALGASWEPQESFRGAETLRRYATVESLRFGRPVSAFPRVPAWFDGPGCAVEPAHRYGIDSPLPCFPQLG